MPKGGGNAQRGTRGELSPSDSASVSAPPAGRYKAVPKTCRNPAR